MAKRVYEDEMTEDQAVRTEAEYELLNELERHMEAQAQMHALSRAVASFAAPHPPGSARNGQGRSEMENEIVVESSGEFLARIGTDASKWAAEFRKIAIGLGYSDMDEAWLIGWFANAIEAGADRQRNASLMASPRSARNA